MAEFLSLILGLKRRRPVPEIASSPPAESVILDSEPNSDEELVNNKRQRTGSVSSQDNDDDGSVLSVDLVSSEYNHNIGSPISPTLSTSMALPEDENRELATQSELLLGNQEPTYPEEAASCLPGNGENNTMATGKMVRADDASNEAQGDPHNKGKDNKNRHDEMDGMGWTREERATFFTAIRRGYDHPFAIHKKLKGAKTLGEIGEYMFALDCALETLKKRNPKDLEDTTKKRVLLPLEAKETPQDTIDDEEEKSQWYAKESDAFWLKTRKAGYPLPAYDKRYISKEKKALLSIFNADMAQEIFILFSIYNNPDAVFLQKSWYEFYKLLRTFIAKLIRDIYIYRISAKTASGNIVKEPIIIKTEDVQKICQLSKRSISKHDYFEDLIRRVKNKESMYQDVVLDEGSDAPSSEESGYEEES
ncbi:hypothetical protein H4219_000022 [Mycoemilia scoparia]|uniref:Uncharacterized protein n=1 Tax=Mycoemilia scoparia TaxID=417184 RepID=A0A9W8A3S8_9FUNG|nr:hypothetical protein H4219_000022 [Mycoemilia scoparia]